MFMLLNKRFKKNVSLTAENAVVLVEKSTRKIETVTKPCFELTSYKRIILKTHFLLALVIIVLCIGTFLNEVEQEYLLFGILLMIVLVVSSPFVRRYKSLRKMIKKGYEPAMKEDYDYLVKINLLK